MFCPECGEVMGPGPLDGSRACHGAMDEEGRASKGVGQRFRAGLNALRARFFSHGSLQAIEE